MDYNYRNIEVVVDDVESNPHCFHGPTLLFKKNEGKTKEYYACSASRDHKECNFYLPKTEMCDKFKSDKKWKKLRTEVLDSINQSKPFNTYLKVLNLYKDNSKHLSKKSESSDCEKSKYESSKVSQLKACYCYTCSVLFTKKDSTSHANCNVFFNLTYHQLTHPTEFLAPKTDNKNEAQYFFSKSAVEDIMLLIKRLKASKILCIGIPRIHEFIMNECSDEIKSILLDLDKSYYNFYSTNHFIWYNMFNNFIFDTRQQQVLHNFLKSDDIIVLMDPPFGGRVEPLAETLKSLSHTFSEINQKGKPMLKTFWFFPYFMEQHIVGSLPDFRMFDYKVNYENHSSFTDRGKRKRKYGSPVRIFTNMSLSLLDLRGVLGYRFCEQCRSWVSNENRHCVECNTCTSKNGRTYTHCVKCSKCVKPSYEHCDTCGRCCLPSHVCGDFKPNPNCYHCHQPGHKKNECLLINERKRRFIDKEEKETFRSKRKIY